VLLVAAVVALAVANSPLADSYADLLHHPLGSELGPVDLREDVRHWVNDGLMAVFFFVVGLEIKRELVVGELQGVRRAALPAIAALGGMVVPAVIYALWNAGGDGARGWGIPMATDIAFALGVLALLASRVPSSLRLFLLSLAIVDDLGAIVVIAVFYADTIETGWLLGAVATVGLVLAMRAARVTAVAAYAVPAVVLWCCTLQSGVHATIAGVVLGGLTPVRPVGGRSIGELLEQRLHPWTSFAVVPLFALANAGVSLGSDGLADAASSRVTWGIVTGLVVGKLVGIVAAVALGRRLGLGHLADDVAPHHVAGVALVAGIGFTVSLFVADLAFVDESLLAQAKLGVLGASVVAGVLGALTLVSHRRRAR
jgi:NhaA family Na+:H+ antiporter